jgi:sulfide dehydrogenase [flavocytochrome c] flavoprotein subunit
VGVRIGRRDFLALALAAAGPCVCAVPARSRPRVAVVGGGFAGAACALHLRSLMPGLEVTLIDPAERYVTCPMSNEVLAGWRSLGSITVARTGLARHGVSLIRDEVAGIDPHERRVRLRRGAPVAYDRLVVAPGIRFLWGQPEGYTEAAAASLPHAWQAGVQTELLASQLKAMRPGGVVAISVPAGPMRCPPGPFERASLIASFLQRNNPRAKVLIFDANNHFPRQDVFMSAWQELYPGVIEWIPVVQGGAVVRVDPAEKILYTADGAHRADVINIIPPQAPARLCTEAGLASDHGWCPIAAGGFESTLAANVHVIGDACIADPMPKSASAAAAQALRCAGAIASALGGRDVPATAIESVCYSLLAPDRALAIRARFEFINGEIRQLPAAAVADAAAATLNARDEVREAAEWYRRILADSFGAGYHPTDS